MNLLSLIITYKHIISTIFIDTISEAEVSNVKTSLKCLNSVCVDGIAGNNLKYCVYYILAPLTHLMNMVLLEGTFVNILRAARIVLFIK